LVLFVAQLEKTALTELLEHVGRKGLQGHVGHKGLKEKLVLKENRASKEKLVLKENRASKEKLVNKEKKVTLGRPELRVQRDLPAQQVILEEQAPTE
jgi:hypothetical protein